MIDNVQGTQLLTPLPCTSDIVINTTVDQILDVQFNWTSNNVTNSLTVNTASLMSIN